MSIIVYGPQGCGKTLRGEQLRRLFRCNAVEEAEWGIYKRVRLERFKAENKLYLTCEEPPEELRSSRCVIAFADAVKMLKDH